MKQFLQNQKWYLLSVSIAIPFIASGGILIGTLVTALSVNSLIKIKN